MDEVDSRYLKRIQKLMEEKIGLHPHSLSPNNWAACVQKRMEACQCQTIGEYFAHLLNSLTEMQQMIHMIVIPETWFFREKRCFDFLKVFAKDNQEKYRKGRPLRILSLGCSTGEEPYSVVMCLLEAAMPLGSFRVEAVDVSKESLDFAQKGIYGKNSFRDKNLEYQRRYFNQVENGYQLKDEIRFSVRYKRGNVVDYPNSQSQNKYDVVLCRNLLIYLSPQLQYNLLKRIEKALMTQGILLLGEAEYDKIRHLDFQTVKYGNISAYCKKEEEKDRLSYKTELFHEIDQILSSGKENEEVKEGKSKKDIDYEKARELADRGRLIEAQLSIEDYIKKFGSDARAFYLQGIIQHAMGRESQAYRLFQKAFYLDPGNEEAKTYLDLMADSGKSKKMTEK